jgi:thioredoxin reductase (NADPH)
LITADVPLLRTAQIGKSVQQNLRCDLGRFGYLVNVTARECSTSSEMTSPTNLLSAHPQESELDRFILQKLDDREIAALSRFGRKRTLADGEHLFCTGDRELSVYIILRGEAQVYFMRGGREREVVVLGEGDVIGDISMLTRMAAVVSVRARGELEVTEIPAKEFRSALSDLPAIAEKVINAFVVRRKWLESMDDFSGVLQIVGRKRDPEAFQLRDFLEKNHIPHAFIEAESEEGGAILQRYDLSSDGPGDLPAVIIGADNRLLRRPSLREIASATGLRRCLDAEGHTFDLLVVGAGPAGLSAAVGASSEGLDTAILERYAAGGQAGSSSKIENYPGFPSGVSGAELTHRIFLQANRFGAGFTASSPAIGMRIEHFGDRDIWVLELEGGERLRSRTVLIATGAQYRRLDAEGRERFEGAGVYYSALTVDPQLYEHSNVVVVGGGNSAGQAIMYLALRAEKVIVIIRGEDLFKSMSSYLVRRIEQMPNVEVLRHTRVRRCQGDTCLTAVELVDTKANSTRLIETSALFSFIGALPHTRWLPTGLDRDEKGFIKTGHLVSESPNWPLRDRKPLLMETSLPGVFAAGDVRAGSTKRCVAAVGEGGQAIECVHDFLGTYAA